MAEQSACRAKFLAAARRLPIRDDAFALERSADEAYNLIRTPRGWRTFYAERGLETQVRTFDSETDALDDLLRRLDGDRTTRA
jgi:hypothetical protein